MDYHAWLLTMHKVNQMIVIISAMRILRPVKGFMAPHEFCQLRSAAITTWPKAIPICSRSSNQQRSLSFVLRLPSNIAIDQIHDTSISCISEKPHILLRHTCQYSDSHSVCVFRRRLFVYPSYILNVWVDKGLCPVVAEIYHTRAGWIGNRGPGTASPNEPRKMSIYGVW